MKVNTKSEPLLTSMRSPKKPAFFFSSILLCCIRGTVLPPNPEVSAMEKRTSLKIKAGCYLAIFFLRVCLKYRGLPFLLQHPLKITANSTSTKRCFDKRMPHLTQHGLMDPLKHYQQGTAVSCLATTYGFEGCFLFCILLINRTCHKPFRSSLRSALKTEGLFLTV